jgi:hypothetical protein
MFGGGRDLGIGFIGDWIQVGALDRAALWDFTLAVADDEFSLRRNPMLSGAEAPLGPGEQPRPAPKEPEQLLGTLPVWGAVHVTNRLTLAATLTTVRAMAAEAAPGLLSWAKDDPYRSVQITRVDVKGDDLKLAVYYCVAKDVLLIALARDVLEERIDQVLDGKSPAAAESGRGHLIQTTLKPSVDGVLTRLAALFLDREALAAHRGAARACEILRRGLDFPSSEDARRTLALRNLGYDPESPQGGEFHPRRRRFSSGAAPNHGEDT